jgi:beta-lactam-binding protein with PASTA domain
MKKIVFVVWVLSVLLGAPQVWAVPGDVWLAPATTETAAGSDFALQVHANSGSSRLGVYKFELTFDNTRVQVNTSIGQNGVEVGNDGFLSLANAKNDEGRLLVNGTDPAGKTPGEDLHLLTINFTAQDVAGAALIGLSVQQFANELFVTIGTPNGVGSTVTVIGGGTQVVVPNVVGLAQAAAETAITDAGLVVGTVTTQTSETIPTGEVISQNPTAGTEVASGSAVDLVVSSGAQPVAVPNVVGMAQAAAETAITDAGLVVGTVTTQASETVPAGEVISQSPTAGTEVASGSAVDLVVSSGVQVVAVPNVVGMAQAAAETAITDAGLVVGTVTTQASDTIPAGEVISQNPTAGTEVAPGSAVDLIVSSGPAMQHILTVRKSGAGTGVVTSDPEGVDCGSDCTKAYAEGTVVTLTAAADADSIFDGWLGALDCADGQVTINRDKTCIAAFSTPNAVLSILDATGAPEATADVVVAYKSDDTIVSMNFIVAYDQSLLTVSDVISGSADPHTVGWRVLEPGQLMLVTPPKVALPAIASANPFATVQFAIDASAPEGQAPITIPQVIAGNANGEAVPVSTVNGYVNIGVAAPGDANGDGEVNALDLIGIVNEILGNSTSQGNADCNGDGMVNSIDMICVVNLILAGS